jgi:hypothetical protein
METYSNIHVSQKFISVVLNVFVGENSFNYGLLGRDICNYFTRYEGCTHQEGELYAKSHSSVLINVRLVQKHKNRSRCFYRVVEMHELYRNVFNLH